MDAANFALPTLARSLNLTPTRALALTLTLTLALALALALTLALTPTLTPNPNPNRNPTGERGCIVKKTELKEKEAQLLTESPDLYAKTLDEAREKNLKVAAQVVKGALAGPNPSPNSKPNPNPEPEADPDPNPDRSPPFFFAKTAGTFAHMSL